MNTFSDQWKLGGLPHNTLIDVPAGGSFADTVVAKSDKEMAIFEGLNFGNDWVEGDDLLGGAYECLMRHFATESGKSTGQFYTLQRSRAPWHWCWTWVVLTAQAIAFTTPPAGLARYSTVHKARDTAKIYKP